MDVSGSACGFALRIVAGKVFAVPSGDLGLFIFSLCPRVFLSHRTCKRLQECTRHDMVGQTWSGIHDAEMAHDAHGWGTPCPDALQHPRWSSLTFGGHIADRPAWQAADSRSCIGRPVSWGLSARAVAG